MPQRDFPCRQPLRLRPGSLVQGGYRIDRRIATGGMATVYEATHAESGHKVALKVLLELYRRDRVVIKRFVNEASAAMAISSPHAVRIETVGYVCQGVPYIAMELLKGADLLQVLRQAGGTLSVEHALYLVDQIAAALGAAHAAKVIHRDLKPENIFVVSTPAGAMVKVLDFGLSKRSEYSGTRLTKTGTTVGTPHYMSPEQLRGDRDIDGRADIYALGALTYELLSGRPPFEGNNAHEVMRLAARSDAEPLSVLCPDLPAGLADVVVKAMHRDRSKRFATTTELREALLPYWSGTRPDFDAPPDATCAPADRARSAPPPAEVVAPVSPEPPTSPPPAAIAQARRVATTPTRVPRRHYRRIIALAVAVCVFFVLITGGVAVTVVDLVRGVHSSAAPGATLPAK